MADEDELRTRMQRAIAERDARQARWDRGKFPPVAYEAVQLLLPPRNRGWKPEQWRRWDEDEVKSEVEEPESRTAEEIADKLRPKLSHAPAPSATLAPTLKSLQGRGLASLSGASTAGLFGAIDRSVIGGERPSLNQYMAGLRLGGAISPNTLNRAAFTSPPLGDVVRSRYRDLMKSLAALPRSDLAGATSSLNRMAFPSPPLNFRSRYRDLMTPLHRRISAPAYSESLRLRYRVPINPLRGLGLAAPTVATRLSATAIHGPGLVSALATIRPVTASLIRDPVATSLAARELAPVAAGVMTRYLDAPAARRAAVDAHAEAAGVDGVLQEIASAVLRSATANEQTAAASQETARATQRIAHATENPPGHRLEWAMFVLALYTALLMTHDAGELRTALAKLAGLLLNPPGPLP